jgi:hypothetical protein
LPIIIFIVLVSLLIIFGGSSLSTFIYALG